MKKTLLTIASALLIVTAQAFPMKGVPYLGGSIGFNSTTNKMKMGSASSDGLKTTSWNVNPEFGYFIADHFSVGLMLNINGSKMDPQDDTSSYGFKERSTMNFGVGLNARKYFQMSETFHIFTGLDLMVSPGKTTTTSLGSGTESETKLMGFGANLNLGVAWNVTEKILIFGKYGVLGYNTTKETVDSTPDKTEYTTSDFGLNVNTFGNPFNVGMYFLLK